MEAEGRNLQNDFFNAARKARSRVTIYLSNGKKLTGRIKSFDKFTVLIEGTHGELMVFKHAVTTVAMGDGTPPPTA
jgi:host factor-I protein